MICKFANKLQAKCRKSELLLLYVCKKSLCNNEKENRAVLVTC